MKRDGFKEDTASKEKIQDGQRLQWLLILQSLAFTGGLSINLCGPQIHEDAKSGCFFSGNSLRARSAWLFIFPENLAL